jgi:hypothetical protein
MSLTRFSAARSAARAVALAALLSLLCCRCVPPAAAAAAAASSRRPLSLADFNASSAQDINNMTAAELDGAAPGAESGGTLLPLLAQQAASPQEEGGVYTCQLGLDFKDSAKVCAWPAAVKAPARDGYP